MKNKPLLSIIVPVYNSEEYISKAVETVLEQDFTDYELILVNDGSSDRSGEICEEYGKKDDRIIYIKKENGGLCTARNCGLDNASGEYIMFMDNDDEYVAGAFRIIADAIENYHTDIIRFNRKRIQIFDDDSKKEDVYGTKGIASSKPVVMSRKEFFNNYKDVRKSGCFSGIWNGAYKRELFDNIKFDETITAGGEDAIVNLELYDVFDSIVFIPDVLYVYYRRTRHSVSTQFQMNQVEAMGKEASLERKLIHDNGLGDDEYFSYAYVYLATLIKLLYHKNSTLTYKDKVDVMNTLADSYYGFRYENNDLKAARISIAKKFYMYLYTNKKYTLLFWITNRIMAIRGNS